MGFYLKERLMGICFRKPAMVAPFAHFVGCSSEVNESCGGSILHFKYSYSYCRYLHLDLSLQSVQALVGNVYFRQG